MTMTWYLDELAEVDSLAKLPSCVIQRTSKRSDF